MANTVIPIRSRDKIETMKKILSPRDRLMFTVGINSALRVSDLLALRVGDVRAENGMLKSEIILREKKTGKEKRFPINESVMKELKEYLQPEWPDDRPLFKSRKGSNRAINRNHAHEILSKAGKQIVLG